MTKVEIFNLALVRVKEPTVQTDTESSHEAETLTVLWPTVIEKMLRTRHWTFARRTVTLAEHADDPPEGWNFRYALPVDMVRPRRTYIEMLAGSTAVFDPITEPQSLIYDMQPNAAETEMTLLSMYESLILEYTFRTVNPLLWPVDFADAVAWHLAMEGVVPLTGRSDLVEYCTRGYTVALSAALTHDANSIKHGPPKDANSIRARR